METRHDEMDQSRMEASVFFDSYLPEALRCALEYAGNDGFVASMPQLLHARSRAPYDNEIWNTRFFTSTSEENVIRTRHGNHVIVVVHGGGIFSTPERFRALYHASTSRHSEIGFTGLFAARIRDVEARDLLEGKLADNREIPVFTFKEFKDKEGKLPYRYATILDFETARDSCSGNVRFDRLKDDPLMIARAGGVEAASLYLDRARDRRTAEVMGSWHNFNEIDPDEEQARILFLGGQEGGPQNDVFRPLSKVEQAYAGTWTTHYRMPLEAEFAIRGDTAMINPARYVAVAPQRPLTGVRHLSFGT